MSAMQILADSLEFKNLSYSMDDETYIRHLYSHVLKRQGEESGVAHWLGHMRSTGVSRAWVMMQFIKSNEFKLKNPQLLAGTVVVPPVVTPTNPPATSGACTAKSAVGPIEPYTNMLNLRFNLSPGQVGTKAFVYNPENHSYNGTVRVSVAIGIRLESPMGTNVALSISKCPGDYDVPAACKDVTGGMGVLEVGPGTKCALEPGATYYLNISHKNLDGSNSCNNPYYPYCTNWVAIR